MRVALNRNTLFFSELRDGSLEYDITGHGDGLRSARHAVARQPPSPRSESSKARRTAARPELTDYEREQVRQIADWKSEPPNPLSADAPARRGLRSSYHMTNFGRARRLTQ